MSFLPFGGSIVFFIVPVFVALGFIFVFGMIIVMSIRNMKQWKKNNQSPVLTVDAMVVTKRTNVSHYSNHAGTDNMNHMSSSTDYYVTFEVISGDRLEFRIPDAEYGMLVEQDKGRLTFQGTRYLGFERTRN